MRKALTFTLILVLLLIPVFAYSQQAPEDDLYEYSLKRTTLDLRGQSKSISEVNFNNLKEIPTARNLKLNQLKKDIKANTDSLADKLEVYQDVSKEIVFYNDSKVRNATEYLLNYKSNLELIESIFPEGTTPVNVSENQSAGIIPFRSSLKIYSAITAEIRKALMEDLNSSDPGSWDQTHFIQTFGSSERFRQYIDKRCDDISKLYNSNIDHLRNTGNSLSSNEDVLEDLYLMIRGRGPVGPLAKGEVYLSDLARISSNYLLDTYNFGLEVIKHNQLLYAPPVSDAVDNIEQNDEKVDESKVQSLTSSKVQDTIPTEIDALRINASVEDQSKILEISESLSPTPAQPTPVKVPEISFKDKYNSYLFYSVHEAAHNHRGCCE